MTQKAAASLSSSLFARKGKASPASLLISEMAAANGGAVPGRPNGSAPRKPKAEADLPLLAYVEAQTEGGHSENDNESGEALTATAETGIAAQAAGAAAQPSPVPKADLPPAASLLDRGARPLRRANGSAPAAAESSDPPQAVTRDQTPQVVEAALQDAGAPDEMPLEEMGEAETVSGDANVAAIEDASDDDLIAEAVPVIVEAADATPTAASKTDTAEVVVSPAADGKSGSAGEAPAESKTAAETKPRPGIKSASEDKTAAAIAASVALRHAKTLNADSALRAPAADKPRPVTPNAMPPRPRVAGQPSRSYLWRGAAVVVLGAALGLGAYLVFAGKPAETPVPVAAALPDPVPVTPAEPAPETKAEMPAAAPATAAPDAESPAATAAAPASAEPELPEPSFDIIRIEPDGQSIIAGRAEPFSEWILLNNGTPIASVRADVNGEWVVLPDASLVPGANAFSLVPKTERGKVAIPAPGAAAPPANQAPAKVAPADKAQAPAAPPSNAVEGALQAPARPDGDTAGLALPKPKPALELLPAAIQVSADGAYEVQLASVRQTEDAARERDRLASAFPDLLGKLDLRVQEAAVDGAGIFYRVRSGAIADLGLARDICRRLEAGGQGCLVVRRAAEAPAPAPVTELVEDVPAAPAVSPAGQQAERPQ